MAEVAICWQEQDATSAIGNRAGPAIRRDNNYIYENIDILSLSLANLFLFLMSKGMIQAISRAVSKAKRALSVEKWFGYVIRWLRPSGPVAETSHVL